MESRSARDDGHLNQQPPWSCYSFSMGSFSWPPQWSSSSYTCGYCKREFRSAQALGGHMNVHRRERARLRECSLNHRAPPPNLNVSPPHRAGDGGATSTAGPVIYSSFSATTSTARMKALEVNLDSGVGVCGGGGGVMEDGLDLELRLWLLLTV